MYANDTDLTYSGFSADNIQLIVSVSHWLIARKITLNTTATQFMFVGSRQKLCALTVLPRPSINGAAIERITSAKSLGVLINDKFCCRSHHSRTKKIASGIGDLKRIRHLFLYGALCSVYLALAQILYHCWGKLRSNYDC